MYEQAYQMCRNVENVMGIFSEELKILDRNTVQLMIDEMQDTINAQQDTIDSQNIMIEDLKRQLQEYQNKSRV